MGVRKNAKQNGACKKILKLKSYLIDSILGFETTDFPIKLALMRLPGLLSVFFFFAVNEEFGCRGFSQKDMQKKYTPLIISFVPSMWHLPLYCNQFTKNKNYSAIELN